MKISIKELKKKKGNVVINIKDNENQTSNISQTDIEIIASNAIKLINLKGETDE